MPSLPAELPKSCPRLDSSPLGHCRTFWGNDGHAVCTRDRSIVGTIASHSQGILKFSAHSARLPTITLISPSSAGSLRSLFLRLAPLQTAFDTGRNVSKSEALRAANWSNLLTIASDANCLCETCVYRLASSRSSEVSKHNLINGVIRCLHGWRKHVSKSKEWLD